MLPIDHAILAGFGLFLGCFARAIFPFLKKKYEESNSGVAIKWEGRYTVTLLFALFASFIVTMLIFPTLGDMAFPIAFATGWASQDVVNLMVK